MKKLLLRITLGLIILVVVAGLGMAFLIRQEFKKLESDDPRVWQSTIEAFQAEAQEISAPDKAILFVGSSSIRFWKNLAQDMAPLPVIKRGFGGAKLRDVIYYADQIIVPYQPRAIVLFAGTNDICGRANDKTPEQLQSDFQELVTLLEKELPDTPLYYLSITPTTSRWEIWPQVQKANQLIRQYATAKNGVHFIDTTPYFLNKKKLPQEELFWWDGVHLNKKGYALWTRVIRERLLKDLQAGL